MPAPWGVTPIRCSPHWKRHESCLGTDGALRRHRPRAQRQATERMLTRIIPCTICSARSARAGTAQRAVLGAVLILILLSDFVDLYLRYASRVFVSLFICCSAAVGLWSLASSICYILSSFPRFSPSPPLVQHVSVSDFQLFSSENPRCSLCLCGKSSLVRSQHVSVCFDILLVLVLVLDFSVSAFAPPVPIQMLNVLFSVLRSLRSLLFIK